MTTFKVLRGPKVPTIHIDNVSFDCGFIIVTSCDKALGIIVHDCDIDKYLFITNFNNKFVNGIGSDIYENKDLEKLMMDIELDFHGPIDFKFVEND